MIIKFFRQGKGPADYMVKYLLSEEKHSNYKPEIISGNPRITKSIVNSMSQKNKYITGVISFRQGEQLDKFQQLELIERFEKSMAPFDGQGRTNFLWVKHFDKGRLELHFLSPRLDLKTKRAFNMHPPGKANLLFINSFCRLMNVKYGFEQVDKKEINASNLRFYKNTFDDLLNKRKEFLFKNFDQKGEIYVRRKQHSKSNNFTISNRKQTEASRKLFTGTSKFNSIDSKSSNEIEFGLTKATSDAKSVFNAIEEYGRKARGQRQHDLTNTSTFETKEQLLISGSIQDQLRVLGMQLTSCKPSEIAQIQARIAQLQRQLLEQQGDKDLNKYKPKLKP